MTDEDKQPYVEKQLEAKLAYEHSMEEYRRIVSALHSLYFMLNFTKIDLHLDALFLCSYVFHGRDISHH